MNKDKLPGWLGGIKVFQFLLLLSFHTIAQPENNSPKIDILHYKAFVKPDISNGTILRKVNVRFLIKHGPEDKIELNSEYLNVFVK